MERAVDAMRRFCTDGRQCVRVAQNALALVVEVVRNGAVPLDVLSRCTA